MQCSTIQYLACPQPGCEGGLLADASSQCANEIREGILTCSCCGAEYPVIMGIAILVPSVQRYLRCHWDEIERCESELGGNGQLSQAMRSYILKSLNGTQVRPAHGRWDQELPWVTARYIWAHYASATDEASEFPAWWGRALADYPSCDTPYDWGLSQLSRHPVTSSPGLAVDIGASVGGMAWRLTRDERIHAVLGVDLAFRAVLTARRLLLAEPAALERYDREEEEGKFVTCGIALDRPSGAVDFVVADAGALPLPAGGVSCATSLNLIDVLPSPTGLFRECARVLGEDGLLMLASPYRWDVHSPQSANPPLDETGPVFVRQHIAGQFAILAESAEVPWLIRLSRRRWNVYLCDCLIARRRYRTPGEEIQGTAQLVRS